MSKLKTLPIRAVEKVFGYLGLSVIAKRGVVALGWCRRGIHQGILNSFTMDASRYGNFAIMGLTPRQMSDGQLLSRLCMLAHGIEKGFSFRERKTPFFVEKFPVFLNLFEEADRRDLIKSSFQGDMSVNGLRAYKRVHTDEQFLQSYTERVDKLLERYADFPESEPAIAASLKDSQLDPEAFKLFFESRSSTRAFSDREVPRSEVEWALECAMKTPSVCNRQPWRVKNFTDRSQIDQALSYQNGNRGFGHEAPGLLVIGCDLRAFFGNTERNEAYVDSGLFAMSVMMALHAKGISSCSLNWCIPPEINEKFLNHFDLPPWFEVGMFLAYGYPLSEDLDVARSPRKSLEDLML
ncbi:MAG: nitroreductase family protein [Akkermansiaceae bacterium]|jgi:nitroreductase|nr:nitroreductase family protein [Akkermansiaceae bacterium]